jgi:2-polyprenyl-6-methoxyphenol hydroxylase-like FAD-dependent oxidoreductase
MSGTPRLRVAVVGCGIGGPATALFLARAGHEVTIFDRSQELGPKGAGILIAPTGQFVLDRLGLLQQVIDKGSRIQRLEGRTYTGRKILDVRYRHLHPGLIGIGIHRGTLFSILHDALNEAKIDIRRGWNVTKIDQGRIFSATGQTDGPYDLVVVSDGARSALRCNLGLQTSVQPYRYGAIWASASNWGDFPDNVLRQSYKGTRRMLGLLPSGILDHEGGRQISIFWSQRLSQLPLWRVNGLDRWKEDVIALMPAIGCLLDQIKSTEDVTIAAYYDVRTWSPVRDHCVVIGDAAHATSPQLGQGASIALFDAMTLAQCIETNTDVLTALLKYKDMRRRNVHFYQLVSKWMTPFFQSNQEGLGFLRDTLLGPACHWPWMQREMVATMCGFKQGPFSSIEEQSEILNMGSRIAFGSLLRDSAV